MVNMKWAILNEKDTDIVSLMQNPATIIQLQSHSVSTFQTCSAGPAVVVQPAPPVGKGSNSSSRLEIQMWTMNYKLNSLSVETHHSSVCPVAKKLQVFKVSMVLRISLPLRTVWNCWKLQGKGISGFSFQGQEWTFKLYIFYLTIQKLCCRLGTISIDD